LKLTTVVLCAKLVLLTLSRLPACVRTEYADFLNDLTPPLPNPKRCSNPYHCEARPQCFTDFKPHYSSNMTLTELVVGTTKWTYDAGATKSCPLRIC
jgi:hypothetical protein